MIEIGFCCQDSAQAPYLVILLRVAIIQSLSFESIPFCYIKGSHFDQD